MADQWSLCGNRSQYIRAWWPFVGWVVFIFIVSSQSTLYLDLDHFMGLRHTFTQLGHYDKYIHASIWAVLTFLLWRATLNFHYKSNCQHIFFVIAICTFLGSVDELHQYFVPQRTSSLFDLAADCTGVVITLILIHLFRRKKSTPYYLPHAQALPET